MPYSKMINEDKFIIIIIIIHVTFINIMSILCALVLLLTYLGYTIPVMVSIVLRGSLKVILRPRW